MKPENKIKLAIMSYVIAGIIAYGHAINHISISNYRGDAQDRAAVFVVSLASGVFWPLYFSVKIQQGDGVNGVEK